MGDSCRRRVGRETHLSVSRDVMGKFPICVSSTESESSINWRQRAAARGCRPGWGRRRNPAAGGRDGPGCCTRGCRNGPTSDFALFGIPEVWRGLARTLRRVRPATRSRRFIRCALQPRGAANTGDWLRMALGATKLDVLALVVQQGMLLATPRFSETILGVAFSQVCCTASRRRTRSRGAPFLLSFSRRRSWPRMCQRHARRVSIPWSRCALSRLRSSNGRAPRGPQVRAPHAGEEPGFCAWRASRIDSAVVLRNE